MIVEKFRDNVGGWHAVVPVCLPAHRSGGDDDIEDHQYDQNQVIIVPAFTGKRSICRSKKGSTCFINTKPKTPHITAKERLVRPLRFKGSLLYSQETVPKAISCTQEQTYSNKAPTTALTKKDDEAAGMLKPVHH